MRSKVTYTSSRSNDNQVVSFNVSLITLTLVVCVCWVCWMNARKWVRHITVIALFFSLLQEAIKKKMEMVMRTIKSMHIKNMISTCTFTSICESQIVTSNNHQVHTQPVTSLFLHTCDCCSHLLPTTSPSVTRAIHSHSHDIIPRSTCNHSNWFLLCKRCSWVQWK